VVERFLREADSTSVLAHPNIVGILDVNLVPDGRPYIVAELLRGDQLGEYLERKGKLRVSETIQICRQICTALAFAHDKGVVHRDIKPENLFLIGKGERRCVKVLDFGISRVSDATATLTKTGMVLGTPAYMPPEQATGARVDHRADIYSLGAIMYEAVTGRRPFDDSDPIATLAAVLTKEPERPCEINPELSPALEHLIQKAMAKKPDERYQSMKELDAALAEFDVPDDSLPKLELPLAERHMRISLPTIKIPASIVRAIGRPERLVDAARTELVVVSVASVLTAVLALIEISASAVRLSRGGEALRGTEIVMAALGSTALLAAPALLWGRYIAERVWSSTPRVIATSMSVCRVLFASLVTYALAMLLVRVFAGALRADAGLTAWPGWDVLIVAMATVAGVHASWHERRRVTMSGPPPAPEQPKPPANKPKRKA
jgi:serine/threonine-protein kinase